MSNAYIIQSLFEILICVLLLIGFLNEDFLALIERKLFRKIKRKFKKIVKWVIG